MAYITKSNIEAVFGVTNVTKWADLDNDGDATKIAARIAVAIAWAENEVDSRLRKSIYTIPFDTAPVDIVDVTANLAGVWLYENRGVQDFNPDTGMAVHRLTWNRKRAYNTLREILAGIRTLDADMTATTFTPEAVADEDD